MSTRVLHSAFDVDAALQARFFSKTVEAANGCLIWNGAVQKHGYGAIKIERFKIDAHVASWRMSHGGIPVPVGFLVMHKCNCRLCVNPSHLILGTPSENALQANADHRGDDFRVRGSDVYNAVLNEKHVEAIRRLSNRDGLSGRAIAEELGVSYAVVRAVLEQRSWSHC